MTNNRGPLGQLSLLITALFFSTNALAANLTGVDVNVGGDGYVRGYSKRTNANVKDQAYAQMLRLKLDLITEDKIKISTRTVLSGDKWKGDGVENAVLGNSDNGNANVESGGNSVRLDYGYIEVPLKGNVIARAGRQTANFSDCFNTCDDRRDRFLVMKFMGKYVPALVYDKRVEGSVSDQRDDSDMVAAALFHFDAVHEWALLYAKWYGAGNAFHRLEDVHNFSPYYKYKGENFTGFVVWNWLGQGDENSWYSGHHNSFAVKGEYRFNNKFELGGQFIYSDNGGLVASGYDTYSFVVNNNPEHNASNTQLVAIGGVGTLTGAQDNEYFAVTRARFFHGASTLALAAGKARQYTGLASTGLTENNLMIYDFQYHYQYSKNLLLKAGLALVRDDRNEEASLFQMETSF